MKNFDRARQVFELERRQEARGQGVISDYFKPANRGTEGGGTIVIPVDTELGRDPG